MGLRIVCRGSRLIVPVFSGLHKEFARFWLGHLVRIRKVHQRGAIGTALDVRLRFEEELRNGQKAPFRSHLHVSHRVNMGALERASNQFCWRIIPSATAQVHGQANRQQEVSIVVRAHHVLLGIRSCYVLRHIKVNKKNFFRSKRFRTWTKKLPDQMNSLLLTQWHSGNDT